MKLTLSFYEESGTERGGCDVALRAELVSDEDPGTGDQAAAEAGRAFNEWLIGAPKVDEDGRFWEGGVAVLDPEEDGDFEPDAEVWVEDGRIKTCESSHYGFSVDQPVEKVLDYVRWLARTGVGHGSPEWDRERGRLEGEWTYSLRTKLYTLTADLFRDGNAE